MKLKKRYKSGLKSFINKMELSNERLELSFGPFNRICYTSKKGDRKYIGAFADDDLYCYSHTFGIFIGLIVELVWEANFWLRFF